MLVDIGMYREQPTFQMAVCQTGVASCKIVRLGSAMQWNLNGTNRLWTIKIISSLR